MQMERLRAAVEGATTCVLGGDIFDFKWSKLDSFEKSLNEAEAWLDRLVRLHPTCEFQYLLGNHDCHPSFVARLDQLADQYPQLSWHPYEFRHGDSLFLHGDIASVSECSHEALERYRQQYRHTKALSPLWHAAYEVVILSGVHRVISKSLRQTRILDQLADYADYTGHNAASGIQHVYFGHTHCDIDGREHRGLTFHNGGASIRGMEFRVIEFQYDRANQRLESR